MPGRSWGRMVWGLDGQSIVRVTLFTAYALLFLYLILT